MDPCLKSNEASVERFVVFELGSDGVVNMSVWFRRRR